jgi:uncharacterized small protein (DUF1192 family)
MSSRLGHHAIERGIGGASLEKLEADRAFLQSLSSQRATRTRVPAGYGAAYYDLRIDLDYVLGEVDARIAVLRAESRSDLGRTDAAHEEKRAATAQDPKAG